MTCPNCQKEINPGAPFCGNCGYRLAAAPQPSAATDILAQPMPSVAASGVPSPPPPVTPWYNGEGGQPQTPTSAPMPVSTPFTGVQPAAPTVPQPPAYQGAEGTFTGGTAPPAYTAPASDGAQHNGKAIAAFVCGVVGCVGWLIPIAGVTLGILALVFGTIAIKSPRRVLAIIGMVLAVPVLAVSIFMWVKGTQQYLKTHPSTSSGAKSSGTHPLSATANQPISSPCYKVSIPTALTVTQTAGSCTFLGSSATTGEVYQVKILQVPAVTAANLPQAAQADANNVVNAVPGGSLSGKHATTFAHSPAYALTLSATDGSAGTIEYVYHVTPQGNLVIVLHTKQDGKGIDLSALENSWSWK